MLIENGEVNLLYVLEKYEGSLYFDETKLLPGLVKEGLYAVCLCSHGRGRSRAAARFLTEQNRPSVCIEGGLEEFSQLDKEEKARIIPNLSVCPNIFLLLNPDEIRQFKEEVELLKLISCGRTSLLSSQSLVRDLNLV